MVIRRVRHIAALAAAAVVGFALAPALQGNDVAPTSGSLPLTGDALVSGDGAPAEAPAYGTGSHWNVFNWGPGEAAAVPASFSYDYVDDTGKTVKKMYVGTGSNPDVGTATQEINLSTSLDSGKTFLTTDRNSPYNVLNAIRLQDGSFIAPDFIPQWADSAHTSVNLVVWRSTDGEKWTKSTAPVSTPADYQFGPMTNGLRLHRRPMQLADGTLVAPFYTVFKGSTQGRSGFLQSTDGGRTWSLRSVIPLGSLPGTNEIGWSRTSDGRLVAIVRTTDANPYLEQTYSDDDGKTWATPTDLVDKDGARIHGIYPDLLLQPNGTLLMTTGRPDVRMYVSYDGTGKSWDVQDTVFANYPSTGNNGRYDGTSGNNDLESVSADRSILFYDQCHVWGCGAYDEQPGVSATYVSAVTPGTGRIDIASKLADKTATVTGDFADPDPSHPTMRPAGAFDGSTEYGSEARLTATHGAPSMVVALDRTYTLDRIGLMLGHGDPESATIQLSTDGKHWSAPVVRATQRSDWSMRYTDFAAQSARYIKVTGAAGTTTTVTELEAYSADTDTFENELPFAVPRGWTGALHSWVTDVPDNAAYTEFGGYHSATALRLWDKWTDSDAHISRTFTPTRSMRASMQWGGQDFRARFTIAVDGQADDGSPVTAWKFRITQGTPATVDVYNGSSWVSAGSLPATLPLRTYLPLSIQADGDQATLTIDGTPISTTAKAGTATKLSALQFSTGDPSEYGGSYLIDDVSIAGTGR